MKELQVIPETAPKGKGMTRNHSVAPKQLWVNKTELAPIVQIQIANNGHTNHTFQNCLLIQSKTDKNQMNVMDR